MSRYTLGSGDVWSHEDRTIPHFGNAATYKKVTRVERAFEQPELPTTKGFLKDLWADMKDAWHGDSNENN